MFRLLLPLLIAILLPFQARAWNAEGHWIVGSIAQRMLTPAAARQVAELLDGQGLADIASWADDWRDGRNGLAPHRETGPWHYVNIPISSAGYDARRDCPRNDCVVAQIDVMRRRLADRSLLSAARA